MLAADFMASFQKAASVPVTKSINWPDSIPAEHPVRTLGLSVRFWPMPVALHLQALADEAAKGWIGRTYWYVIAATVCKLDGTSAFCENWSVIWQAHCEESLAAYDKKVAETFPTVAVEARPVFLTDDSGNFAVPSAPDYYIVGEWLKKQFDSAQGEAIMKPLWDSSMDYNGWRADDSKNSVTTDSSVPSGERPTVGV